MLKTVASLFDAPTQAVLAPAKEARELRKDHFATDLAQLRFPATLDFSHANFKLRELNLLRQAREAAPREINVSGNELTSLDVLNRFHQLRSLVACANALVVGGGLVLRLPQLLELDLASNRLSAMPALSELPRLQVLRVQNNQIVRNWAELKYVAKSLRELDAGKNRLNWAQQGGEFDAAMAVLGALKGLKELRLGGNPVCETPGLRYMVVTYAPRLARFDGLPVTEHERRGKVRGASLGFAQVATMVAPETELMGTDGGAGRSELSDEEGGGSDGGDGYDYARRPGRLASLMREAADADCAPRDGFEPPAF